MTSTYLITIFLAASLIAFPEETMNTITAISLKIQVFYLNYRMKWQAWLMYRQLVRMCDKHGMPTPGPFKFVNIWDRN